ncbi:MAG: hypothetical protein U0892_01045 [Pirellulales bacterium]
MSKCYRVSLALLVCLGAFGYQASISAAQERVAPPPGKTASGKESGESKPAKSTKKDSKNSDAKAKAKNPDEPVFVRVLMDDKKQPVKLQTAIVSYEVKSGEYRGARVDLIGAIHIADKAYFADLNKRFKEYDVVLYEMVADPEHVKHLTKNAKTSSGVSAVQSGMKDMLGLSFQLDEVDYQAKNFVHADMNPEEFSESLSQRQEGVLQFVMRSMGSSLAMQSSRKTNDLDMLAAMLAPNRELAMKRVLSQQLEMMDGQLAAISGDDGKSTLITERNAKALEVLKRELESGKKKIAIFYGAGHFKHMSEELDTQFGLKPATTFWLDAWNMEK